MFLSKKKKLFCAFIDYQKAFDTIWQSGLWSKLIASGISGKVFNVIRNIYQCVKSCVSMNGNKSDYFMSYTGVRQGENLSPLLFSLYINDLENFLVHKNVNPVAVTDEITGTYLKIFFTFVCRWHYNYC